MACKLTLRTQSNGVRFEGRDVLFDGTSYDDCCKGCMTDQVVRCIGISPHTVDFHI
jgi:hypothetical protein